MKYTNYGYTRNEVNKVIRDEKKHSYYLYAYCYNNKIVYIRIGSKYRVTDLSSRNKAYKEFLNKVGKENIRYIIIEFTECDEEALYLERKLHEYHRNLYSSTKRGNFNRRVLQIDIKSNGIIKVWEGARYVQNELGLNHSSITRCCQGIRNNTYGYKWLYMDDLIWS